jgi:hypothetical protein
MARNVKSSQGMTNIPVPDIGLHMQMNDSAHCLVDWVLHHRHIGFERITVYDDAATAEATALGMALETAGLISFVPTDTPGFGRANIREIRGQTQALEAEQDHDSDGHMIWLQPEDFLVVDVGEGRLSDMVAALDEMPDILSLTTQLIGGSGHRRFEDAPLPERFTKGTGGGSGPLPLRVPIRTILRPGKVRRLNMMRPKVKPKYIRGKEPISWLNGAGEDVRDQYLDKGWAALPEKPGLGLAHVRSYQAQDCESFLLRKTGADQPLPFMTPEHLRGTIQRYRRFNFAMAETGPFGAGPQDLSARRAAFFTAHPAVAEAHAAAIAEFSTRMERLLAVQDPKAVKIVGDLFLGRPLRPVDFDWQIPAGAQVTQSVLSETDSDWAEKLTRSDGEDGETSEAEDWTVADEDEAGAGGEGKPKPSKEKGAAPEVAAPDWLMDLRLSGHATGFYHSMPNYACTYVERSRDHLLLSFDNLASVKENPVERMAWGYGFIRKSGWSHMGVLSFVPGWFRDRALFDYLKNLRDSGFFAQFKQVTMFGTSMGGYGAAAFSSLVPGCRVAAFSPQSTLAPRIVPWDFRYPTGRQMDWSGEFSDAAVEIAGAEQAWLFYDPAVEQDRRHIERFTTPNIRRIPLRYADHKTALMLRNGGLLSSVMRQIVTGQASVEGILRAYRGCRTLPDYVDGLRARAERTGGEARLEWVNRCLAEMVEADAS